MAKVVSNYPRGKQAGKSSQRKLKANFDSTYGITGAARKSTSAVTSRKPPPPPVNLGKK